MLIDTHCHLDFDHFDPDRPQVIKRAQDAGVEYIINVGADLAGSLKSVTLANDYSCIFAAVGIHPHYAQHASDSQIKQIEEFSVIKKVVAFGEVGLDYYDRQNPNGQVAIAVQKSNKNY
ncbi:MAG: TatD family hydrolase [Candidatus Omnitrophota bacterium]